MVKNKENKTLKRCLREQLRNPDEVYQYLSSLQKLLKETFHALYLDVKGRLIYDETVSIGTLTMNLVHAREVFRPAIEHAAASVILAHNHPSGDPTPSAEDLQITRQLVEVGKLIDIQVLDHVIIGEGDYVSLRRKGLMDSGAMIYTEKSRDDGRRADPRRGRAKTSGECPKRPGRSSSGN